MVDYLSNNSQTTNFSGGRKNLMGEEEDKNLWDTFGSTTTPPPSASSTASDVLLGGGGGSSMDEGYSSVTPTTTTTTTPTTQPAVINPNKTPERESDFKKIDGIGFIGMRDKQNKLLSVTVGDVDDAIRNGLSFDDPDTEVPVFLPDGTTGYLSHQDLQERYSQGYSYKGYERELVDWADSHPERLEKAIKESSTFGTTALMVVDSIASGLTMGLTDTIAGQFMNSQDKKDRMLFIDNHKAINTIANMAGSVVLSAGITAATVGVVNPLTASFAKMGFSVGATKLLAAATIASIDASASSAGFSVADSVMREVEPKELAKRAVVAGGVGLVLGAGLSAGFGALGNKLTTGRATQEARTVANRAFEEATGTAGDDVVARAVIPVDTARMPLTIKTGDAFEEVLTFSPVNKGGKIVDTTPDVPSPLTAMLKSRGHTVRRSVKATLARGLPDEALPLSLQDPSNFVLKELEILNLGRASIIDSADEVSVMKNILDSRANGVLLSESVESLSKKPQLMRLFQTYGDEAVSSVDNGNGLYRYYTITQDSFKRAVEPVDASARAVEGLMATAEYITGVYPQQQLRSQGMTAEAINMVQRLSSDVKFAKQVESFMADDGSKAYTLYRQKILDLEDMRETLHASSEKLRLKFAASLDEDPTARQTLGEAFTSFIDDTDKLYNDVISDNAGSIVTYENNASTRAITKDILRQREVFLDPESITQLKPEVKPSDVFNWIRSVRSNLQSEIKKGAGKRIGAAGGNDFGGVVAQLKQMERSVGDVNLYNAIQKSSSDLASLKGAWHKAYGIKKGNLGVVSVDDTKVRSMLSSFSVGQGSGVAPAELETALIKALRNNREVFEKFDIVDQLPASVRNVDNILNAGFVDEISALKFARRTLPQFSKSLAQLSYKHQEFGRNIGGIAAGAFMLGAFRSGGAGSAVMSNTLAHASNSVARGIAGDFIDPITRNIGGINLAQNLAGLSAEGAPQAISRGFFQRIGATVTSTVTGARDLAVDLAIRGAETNATKVLSPTVGSTATNLTVGNKTPKEPTKDYVASTMKAMGLEPRRSSESRAEYYNRRVEAVSKYANKAEARALLDPFAETLNEDYADAMADNVAASFARIQAKLPPTIDIEQAKTSYAPPISREDIRILDSEIELVFNPAGLLNRGLDDGDLDALSVFEEAYPEYVEEMRSNSDRLLATGELELPLDTLSKKQQRAVSWLTTQHQPTENELLPAFNNFYAGARGEEQGQESKPSTKPLRLTETLGALSRSQQMAQR